MRLQTSIYIVLVCALGLLSLGFATWRPKQFREKMHQNETLAPLIELKNVCMRGIEPKTQIGWEVHGETADYSTNPTTILCKNTACRLLRGSLPFLTMQAARAYIEKNSHNLILEEEVCAKTGDFTLVGTHVVYDYDAKQLSGSAPITVYHPQLTVNAQLCSFDVEMGHLQLDGGVVMTLDTTHKCELPPQLQ